MTPVPLLDSVARCGAAYPLWLCDIWGVLHNGAVGYPAAAEALKRRRAEGGLVILLSNAPRPNPSVAEQIAQFGFGPETYDAIVTSGDVSRSLIAEAGWRRIHHVGPERDLALFRGLDVALSPVDRSEAIVCSGLLDDATETPSDYEARLEDYRRRNLLMLCANPDLAVEKGARIIYCAGAIGAAYEKLGGEVIYAGKPMKPIYDAALALARTLSGDAALGKPQTLAIGDGLKTDIRGAADYGIDSLFVGSALHGADLDAAKLDQLFASGPRPIAAMRRLAW